MEQNRGSRKRATQIVPTDVWQGAKATSHAKPTGRQYLHTVPNSSEKFIQNRLEIHMKTTEL